MSDKYGSGAKKCREDHDHLSAFKLKSSLFVNQTFRTRTFGSLKHAAQKNWGKIMTLESLNMSLTLLNMNGRIRSSSC
jgi:hypothetical protein